MPATLYFLFNSKGLHHQAVGMAQLGEQEQQQVCPERGGAALHTLLENLTDDAIA